MNDEIISILNKINPNSDFVNSDNFIDDGLLDSVDVLALIEEIETKYGVVIKSVDIDPDNFSSVNGIAQMISKYIDIE